MASRAGSLHESIGMKNHQSQTRSNMLSGTSPHPPEGFRSSQDQVKTHDHVPHQTFRPPFRADFSPSLPETCDFEIQDKALVATAAIEQHDTEAEDSSQTKPPSSTPAPSATQPTPLERLLQLAPIRYLPSSPFLPTMAAPGLNFEFNPQNFGTMQGAATRFLDQQNRFHNTLQQKNEQIQVLQARNAQLLRCHADPGNVRTVIDQNLALTNRIQQVQPKWNDLVKYADTLRNNHFNLLVDCGETNSAKFPGPIPHVSRNKGVAQQQAQQPLSTHQTAFQTRPTQPSPTIGATQAQNPAAQRHVNPQQAYLPMQPGIPAGQRHQSQHIPATQGNRYAGQAQSSQNAMGAQNNGYMTPFEAMSTTNAVQHANNNLSGSNFGLHHAQSFNNGMGNVSTSHDSTQAPRGGATSMPIPSAQIQLPDLPLNSMVDGLEGSDLTYLWTQPAQNFDPIQQQTLNTQAQISRLQLNGCHSNNQPDQSAAEGRQSVSPTNAISIELTQEPAHADASLMSSPHSQVTGSPDKQSTAATSPDVDNSQQQSSREASTAPQTATLEQQAAEGSRKRTYSWYKSSATPAYLAASKTYGIGKHFKDANGRAIETDHPDDEEGQKRRKEAADLEVFEEDTRYARDNGLDETQYCLDQINRRAEDERQKFKGAKRAPVPHVLNEAPVQETEERKMEKVEEAMQKVEAARKKKQQYNREYKAARKNEKQLAEDQTPVQAIEQPGTVQTAQRKEAAGKVVKSKKAGKELSTKQQVARERTKATKANALKEHVEQIGLLVEETARKGRQASSHSKSRTTSEASFDSKFALDDRDSLFGADEGERDKDSLFGDDNPDTLAPKRESEEVEEDAEMLEVMKMLAEQSDHSDDEFVSKSDEKARFKREQARRAAARKAEADEAEGPADYEKYLVDVTPERRQYSELIIEDGAEMLARRNEAAAQQAAMGKDDASDVSVEE